MVNYIINYITLSLVERLLWVVFSVPLLQTQRVVDFGIALRCDLYFKASTDKFWDCRRIWSGKSDSYIFLYNKKSVTPCTTHYDLFFCLPKLTFCRSGSGTLNTTVLAGVIHRGVWNKDFSKFAQVCAKLANICLFLHDLAKFRKSLQNSARLCKV